MLKEIHNKDLDESYHEIIHASGLTILVMPKAGYSSAYAVFAAKYGSIDTHIALADGCFADFPEGTAHFLEHKLFESEELAAFERFASGRLRQCAGIAGGCAAARCARQLCAGRPLFSVSGRQKLFRADELDAYGRAQRNVAVVTFWARDR